MGIRRHGNRAPRRYGPLLLLTCLMLAAACASAPPTGTAPLTISAAPLALDPDDTARTRLGELTYAGGLALTSPDPRFGGWSDLCLAGDGRLYAVSDQGWWLAADLVLDGRGDLTGLTAARLGRLGGPDGPLPSAKKWSDAEALDCGPDGFVAAFERRHRLVRYPAGPEGLAARPAPLRAPAWLAKAPKNQGPEALALLPDGRLLVLTEGLAEGTDLVGGLGRERAWQKVLWPRRDLWRPTSAAALPDGDLLVLERSYFVGTVEARLWRVPAAQLAPTSGEDDGPRRLAPRLLATLSPPLSVDNMEGLAARPEGGRIAVYLISDDNYSPLQRTLLMKFWLEN